MIEIQHIDISDIQRYNIDDIQGRWKKQEDGTMAGIKALMEKLEADAAFAGEIIKAGSVEERMDKVRQEGLEITAEKIAQAQTSA